MADQPHMTIGKILCAVDGSAPACRAAEIAACIARDMGAEIRFVSVARPAKPSPELEKYAEAEGLTGTPLPFHVPEAEACLKQAVEVARDCGAATVESAVEVGDVFETLSSVIRAKGVDLVVLGHHARTSVGRLARKPVSQRLADEGAVKLLLVP